MIQVSTQRELLSALNSKDPLIQITAGFPILSQINITYPVTIKSLTADHIFTLTKDETYAGYLFRISGGGSLTIQNLIIDGAKAAHDDQNTSNRSLIYVTGGTLHLDGGSVLQNNVSASQGGAVNLTSSSSAVNTLLMENTARIISCSSVSNGGGIMINAVNPQDSYSVTGEALIDGNASVNGGGIFYRSYAEAAGSLLTLKDKVHITNNSASGTGGGICTVLGKVTIQDSTEIACNSTMACGGGLSAAEQSSIAMAGGSIHDNRSSQYGGGVWNHDSSTFSMTGGSVCSNQAEYGGAFYNDLGGILSLTGGLVCANYAAVGGGVYNSSSSDTAISDSAAFGIDDQNTASFYGQDIYNEGRLYAEGKREISNGVYPGSKAAAVKIRDLLAGGSLIQLEHSGYVTPNAQGTPIVVGEAVSSCPLLSQEDADAFQKPPAGFDGWEIRLSEGQTQVLLAPVIYTVHYENLMKASCTNPSSYTIHSPDIRLNAPGPLAGYRFLGWFDAPSGGNRVTVITRGSSKYLTLYARWEKVNSYTVTYHGNESCRPPAHCIPLPVTAEEDTSFLISGQRPVRQGYRFLGWNTEPYNKGISYLPGMSVSGIHADLNLYAMWKKCCSFCLS